MADEDDGMLLNFTTTPVTSAGPVNNTVITGGRWRDRLKAKRVARGEDPVRKTNANTSELGRKRTKFDPDSQPRDGKYSGRKLPAKSAAGKFRKKDPKPKTTEPKPEPKIKPKFDQDGDTFVSSIFSKGDSDISTTGSAALTPGEASNAPLHDSSSFLGLGLDERLATALSTTLKLSGPTGIQKAVLPRLVREDRDLFVQAQTGSGKTLAYVLPILHRLITSSDTLDRTSGLFSIILAPTRELSNQIHSVLEVLCRSCCRWIVPGIVIGGEKKKSEKARIRKGVNILVATPGRLADHFDNTTALDLSNVRYLVLDEGDRLMELGFEETIAKILGQIKKSSNFRNILGLPSRQVNIICSATMKSDVKKLGELSLHDSDWVTPEEDSSASGDVANGADDGHYAPDQLIQKSTVVPPKLRLITLTSILIELTEKKDEQRRIMVFLSCSDTVDFHFALFGRDDDDNVNAEADSDDENEPSQTIKKSSLLSDTTIYKLHGSLNQTARTKTLMAFKNDSKTSIMFCTDVASRGLDLPLITDVVEYDPPFNKDDHLHRIGRTARAGKKGTSILFLLPSETGYLDVIKPLHHGGVQNVTYQQLLKEAFGGAWETDATTWHLNTERWLLHDVAALGLAKRGFTSHIRAYATHISSEKEIFNMKSLHLGHLAKSFGLRDPPGQKTSAPSKKRKFAATGTSSDPNVNRKRMLNMARKMDSMSEFNIG